MRIVMFLAVLLTSASASAQSKVVVQTPESIQIVTVQNGFVVIAETREDRVVSQRVILIRSENRAVPKLSLSHRAPVVPKLSLWQRAPVSKLSLSNKDRWLDSILNSFDRDDWLKAIIEDFENDY